MAPTSRLYHALSRYLSNVRFSEIQWQDARQWQTLCWMLIGRSQSQNVHLNELGLYVKRRASTRAFASAMVLP